MLDVCIMGHVFGEDVNLIVSNERFKWSSSIPENCWILGDSLADLDLTTLSVLSGLPLRVTPAERFVKAFSALNSTHIRWRLALPAHEFSSFLSQMMGDIKILLSEGCVAYYTEAFRGTRKCLRALERACIDGPKLDQYAANENNETNRSALLSFKPESDGFSKSITYGQTSTITGRLVVQSGPRILTLPKCYKDIIISRYAGGKVFALDFRSLEPRVVLAAQGMKPARDIYSEIASSVFNDGLSVKDTKVVVISLLYGAQTSSLATRTTLKGAALDDAVKRISDFFAIDAFEQRLVQEAKGSDRIKNYYGRPVEQGDRRKLVNRYVQSSAVDAALLGFGNAIDLIKKNEWMIHPLFSIHDAMIFDAHPDYVQYIEQVRECSENVPGFSVTFPVRYEEIGSV